MSRIRRFDELIFFIVYGLVIGVGGLLVVIWGENQRSDTYDRYWQQGYCAASGGQIIEGSTVCAKNGQIIPLPDRS